MKMGKILAFKTIDNKVVLEKTIKARFSFIVSKLSANSLSSCVSPDYVSEISHVKFLTPKNITNSFVILNSGSVTIF